ncbi:MAG: HipA N-terminal domain-containing protein [Corticimicrobacter sp.]|uniref:HipA N-terminal domain-containing protein n=1 Tax=Corticimicrobacter sp. TaxID=2678536 RepID=UPI0032DA93E3
MTTQFSRTAYVQTPKRPTLSLGFKDSFGELLTDVRAYRSRLMPFFSNLLPEGHLRRYLAEKTGIHPDREFLLLQALGQGKSIPAHESRSARSHRGSPAHFAHRCTLSRKPLVY